MQFIDSSKDPGVVERAVLSNGITLYHRQYTPPFGLPKVAATVLIMAGGRDDAKGKEGSAHFFEHMPFRGTENFPTLLELSYPVETNGGYMNAFTGDEITGYELDVPTTMMEDGIKRLADMLLRPKMDVADLELERQVIIEELHNKLANVGFFASQKLYGALLGDHPVVHAVVGTEEALGTITKQDLLDFHARYYNASNIYLFFAGEYNTAELVQLCEKYFGSIAKGEATKRDVPVKAPTRTDYMQVFSPKQFNRSVYLLGRSLEELTTEQMIMWRLYIKMLGAGMNSPLQNEIREKRGLAYGLNVGMNSFRDVSVFTFNVSSRFKNMDEIDIIFWEQAHTILQNQDRFKEVKHMLKQQVLFKEYSVSALVDASLNSFDAYGKVMGINEYLTLVEAMTLEQVRDYITPFLDKDKFTNIRVNCDKQADEVVDIK